MNAVCSLPVAAPAHPRATLAPRAPVAPVTAPELLLATLPQNLVSALGELPRRLLFTNASLSLLLVGLADGQIIRRLRPPTPVLLTVAFGSAVVIVDGWRFGLSEGQQWTLEPRATYDVEADGCVDLLLLLQADTAQAVLPTI
jgi:hypothetical protein